MKVLGTPSKDQMGAMNPKFPDKKFPKIRALKWASKFDKFIP